MKQKRPRSCPGCPWMRMKDAFLYLKASRVLERWRRELKPLEPSRPATADGRQLTIPGRLTPSLGASSRLILQV